MHPAFVTNRVRPRTQFLSSLGLSPDVFTVCINTGWAGNTHLLDTYTALKNCNRKLQAIILSGHNQELHAAAVARSKQSDIPTVVLPSTNNMSDLMNAVDLMVTKAGGLTTYQALARRLPLALDNTIKPMPQEASTLKMLVDCGLAARLDHPDELPIIVDSMRSHQSRNTDLPKAFDLDLTDQEFLT